MAKFSDLCEDTLVQIMSWLPPESLLLLKCVQKSWNTLLNALIRDQKFVAKHLQNSNKKSSYLVFKFTKFEKIEKFPTNLYRRKLAHSIIAQQGSLTIGNDEDKNECLSYIIDDFTRLGSRVAKISLLGSHCDGIICLANEGRGHVLLCNPATRDFKILPNHSLDFISWIGFGYDPVANVYKVVMVFKQFRTSRAEVYTLGTETWREIKVDVDTRNHASFEPTTTKQVYCEGVYYWLVLNDYLKLTEIIYAFDFHDEEFHSIPLPDKFQSVPHDSSTHLYSNLTRWNEHVALLYYPWFQPIEVWILHESSKDHTSSPWWTKLVSIGPLRGGFILRPIPIAFWTTDELLISEGKKSLRGSEQCLASCNIVTKKVTVLEKGEMKGFSAFGYVKSLVSVGGKTPTRITNPPDDICSYSLREL